MRMRRDTGSREYPESMSVRYSHVRFRGEEFRVHSDFTVNAGFDKLYAGLKKPSLSRFGETDDRGDELI